MFKKRSIYVLLLFVIAFVVPGSYIMATETTIREQEREKEELIKKKDREAKKLKKLKKRRKKIEESIRELDRKAAEIDGNLEEISGRIKENKAALKKIENELKEAEKIAEDQYKTMKRRIRYMYENGDSGYFDLIAGSKNVEELLNRAEYMAEIAEYDNGLLETYNAAVDYTVEKKEEKREKLRELADNKEKIEIEKDKNAELADAKKEKFKEYNSLIKASDAAIDKVSGEIAEKSAYIDELIAEEERRRLEEERRRAEEERLRLMEERRKKEERERLLASGKTGDSSETVPDPSLQENAEFTRNGFLWPLPSGHRISSGFGYRGEIIKGSGIFHSGIDLPAPKGSPILASASGTVVAASYHYSMGNYVLLSHGDGVYTVYMHSSRILVLPGDQVNAGQTIALVGSTGFSTGPHLHFGIKVDGAYRDPLLYVSP